jgi:hypothetical protein
MTGSGVAGLGSDGSVRSSMNAFAGLGVGNSKGQAAAVGTPLVDRATLGHGLGDGDKGSTVRILPLNP